MRRGLGIMTLLLTVSAVAGGLAAGAGASVPAARGASAPTPSAIVCPLTGVRSTAVQSCCGPIAASAVGTTRGVGATGGVGTTGGVGVAPEPCCPEPVCDPCPLLPPAKPARTGAAARPAIICCAPIAQPAASPAVGCCTPAPCGSEPSISSSPNPAPQGAPITVSGRIQSGAGTRTVVLWQRLPGRHGYTQLQRTTASSGGTYVFHVARGTARTNRRWCVTVGSARSLVDAQLVRAHVTLAARRVRAGVGSLRGTVTPAQAPGRRVAIEERAASQWSVVGYARLSKAGHYHARIGLVRGQRHRLRVELAGNPRNAQSFSNVASLGRR